MASGENGKKKVPVSFSITVEMDELIDLHCDLYDCSKSDVAMQAFRLFLAFNHRSALPS